MKHRPILFNAPMVRAILRDDKTETRRPHKSDKPPAEPGDRLWVRETFRDESVYSGDVRCASIVAYKATSRNYDDGPWIPSIHMPRWASRIDLLVTELRFEPLHLMSDYDATLEGFGSLAEFRAMWDSIYGKTEFAWERNPYVWTTVFQRVQP